jgi:hypothetical protein
MAKYKFLNLNPLGEREQDCVCRAISLALEEDYYTIENKLNLIGDLFECEELCVCCYKHLLDYVYGLDRIEEFRGFVIEDFLDYKPSGTFLIRIEGHLTCAIDGEIYDIWDCSKETIDLIWIVC